MGQRAHCNHCVDWHKTRCILATYGIENDNAAVEFLEVVFSIVVYRIVVHCIVLN